MEGIRPQVSGHREGDQSEAPLADQVGRDGAQQITGNRIGELHGEDGTIGTTMVYNKADPPLEGAAVDDSPDCGVRERPGGVAKTHKFNPMTPMRGLQIMLKVMMQPKIGKQQDVHGMVNKWEGLVHVLERDCKENISGRTVVQIVVSPQVVPSLDVLVPQMENQLVEVCRQLDTHIPEQAIEVPKILLDDVPMRTALRDTQLAEQLVEVPTIVSYSSLHGFVEQNVAIPVPHGRGRVGGGAEHRFPAATAEQIVDIPRGGGQDPDLPSAASSSGLPGTANQGVFRTFAREKESARLGPHSGSELVRTSAAAQLEGFFTDAAGGVWMQFPDGRWKLLGSDPEVWWPG